MALAPVPREKRHRFVLLWGGQDHDQSPDSLEGGGRDDALHGMGDLDGCDGVAATHQLASCKYPNWGPRYRTNDAR